MRRAACPTLARHGVAACLLGGAIRHTMQNPSQPGYGDAEYKSDLAQCRKQNSKIVTSSGYDDRSESAGG